MEGNLICTNCGADYYSASPNLAKETTECDNGCGLSLEVRDKLWDDREVLEAESRE